jgi:hypothetical protein
MSGERAANVSGMLARAKRRSGEDSKSFFHANFGQHSFAKSLIGPGQMTDAFRLQPVQNIRIEPHRQLFDRPEEFLAPGGLRRANGRYWPSVRIIIQPAVLLLINFSCLQA